MVVVLGFSRVKGGVRAGCMQVRAGCGRVSMCRSVVAGAARVADAVGAVHP